MRIEIRDTSGALRYKRTTCYDNVYVESEDINKIIDFIKTITE